MIKKTSAAMLTRPMVATAKLGKMFSINVVLVLASAAPGKVSGFGIIGGVNVRSWAYAVVSPRERTVTIISRM